MHTKTDCDLIWLVFSERQVAKGSYKQSYHGNAAPVINHPDRAGYISSLFTLKVPNYVIKKTACYLIVI